MRISNSCAVIGAFADGVDLSAGLSPSDFERLEAAFNERSVLCIRDQTLTPDAYIAFANRFGAVQRQFMTHYAHPAHADILLVSNIQADGKNIGHADAGRVWHTDMSYVDQPPRATLLYAREVPIGSGGRPLGATEFASAVAAYDGLPAATRALIDGRTALHRVSGRRKSTGTGREDNALRDRQPDVVHPVARTNPVTGQAAIYVSEGECVSISGLPDADAAKVVAELCGEIQRPEYRYVHEWRAGDVLIWDNAAVQHLATFDYRWPEHRRLMWRITVGGAA